MGLTVAEYDETPALVVDWDLQMHRIEQEIEADAQKRAADAARAGGS